MLFLILRQSNIHVERPMTPSGFVGFQHFFPSVSLCDARTHVRIVTHTRWVRRSFSVSQFALDRNQCDS